MHTLVLNLGTLLLTGIGTVIALDEMGRGAQAAALGIVVLVALLVLIDFFRNKPTSYRSDKRIRRFMHKWIKHEGRVVIFSNDLSWVRPGEEIKTLLLEKAASSDLTLCLPKPIPLSNELLAAGATVYTYEPLGYVPVSRFTVIRAGRQDSRVAVGRRIKEVHTIEQFGPGEHPAYGMAEDLIQILSRVSQAQTR